MAKQKTYPFDRSKLDWTICPGYTLEETIEALGMSQTELAARAGMAHKTVNEIIQGKAPISPDTAIKFERVTGVPADLWNRLEAGYRADLVRLAERKRLADDLAWAKTFPVKELVKRGAIAVAKGADLVVALLQFFGVANRDVWEQLWREPCADFRRIEGKDRCALVATWLRLGELEARKVKTEPYSKPAFEAALAAIRKLTAEPPERFVKEMVERCAAAGVAVVLVPEIPRAGVYGATRWLTPEKALIQLSLYRKSDDQFWFSFFHEAGHVLKHGKKERFIEEKAGAGADPDKEAEANAFAEEILVPARHRTTFEALRYEDEIAAFAKRIGIAPGIVVGQLQKKKLLSYKFGNRLKRRLDWAEQEGGGKP